MAGLASNSIAMREWSAYPSGEPDVIDVTACLNAVVDSAERVKRGDLGDAEALLMAQAVTLNALFTDLAHRAHVSQYVDHFERYLRLALKSQNQCRTTLETLAVVKNPTAVFARQANIAHGPQQVNNSAVLSPGGRDVPRARAGNQETEQIEVLETHGEQLDGAAPSPAGSRNPAMAPVGMLNRSPNG